MKNSQRKKSIQFITNFWHLQGWIIGFIIYVLLLAAWAIWASSFGVKAVYRDNEIRDLIVSAHDWENATSELHTLRQVISANPISISDPIQTLNAAEKNVSITTDVFEKAGYKALPGEMIIISGIILQIIATLILVSIVRSGFDRIRRKKSVSHDHAKWVSRFRNGNILDEYDELIDFIDNDKSAFQFSETTIKHGSQVKDLYKRLLARIQKVNEIEIPWNQIASFFYKSALVCKERGNKEFEAKIREQYLQLRHVIAIDTLNKAYSSIGLPVMFLVLFTLLSAIWGMWVDVGLGIQLAFWRIPILLIGSAFATNGIVEVWGNSFVRWFAEKTWGNLDEFVTGIIIRPLSVLTPTILLLTALNILLGPATPPLEVGPFLTWIGHVTLGSASQTFVLFIIGVWFTIFVVNRLIVYFLDSWATTNGQSLDELAIRTVQLFATFSILAIAIVILLSLLRSPISEVVGTDITPLLSIVVAVIGAIIGYASRFAFENFVSGLLLQIEKPFEKNDRIELPDGRLCVVYEVGLRSTVLYNLHDASIVSIPNSELTKWSIANQSRTTSPRITASVWIANPAQVKLAQGILLDISYRDGEIDQMRVFDDELTSDERNMMDRNMLINGNRNTIERGMEQLIKRYEWIRTVSVSQIIGGGKSEPKLVFVTEKDPYLKLINNIRELRQRYALTNRKEDEWLYGCIKKREENPTVDVLKNYRRAINEIIYSESTSLGLLKGSETNDRTLMELFRKVAHHEGINPDKFAKVLDCLSGISPTRTKDIKKVVLALNDRLAEFETERLSLVLNIRDEVAVFENYIFAIGEQHPNVRPDLETLMREINREPSISSEYSDDGQVKLNLLCYGFNSQRKLEIVNKINTEISVRFTHADIKFK